MVRYFIKMIRKTHSYSTTLLLLLLVSLLNDQYHILCVADPSDGFTEVPLTDKNFVLQKPYDKPSQDRYRNKDGVRSLWVHDRDKPFKPGSATMPSAEIRIQGHDFSSGVWQFEGFVFIPKGTSGVSIMQIFGAAEAASTLQLRIYDEEMKRYNSKSAATNIYDKWIRVNVIHDVGKEMVTIFIDGERKLVKDRGPNHHYFKCGVYAAPDHSSDYMESRWRDNKIYRK